MRRFKKAARVLFVFALTAAVALDLLVGVPTNGLSPKDTADLSILSSNSPQIAIRAINPGYTIDGVKNTGELIELVNLTDDELLLDNLAIIYTAKSSSADMPGKSTTLYTFPPGSKFVGRSILLRYKFAPEATSQNQDIIYDTSLAMAGALSLVDISSEEIINSVCWLGGEDCLPIFSTTVKSRSYTTILRDDLSGEYLHVNDAELLYNPDEPGLYLPPELEFEPNDTSLDEDASKAAQCTGLEFSEIFSYYDADATEQFIELYNNSDVPLELFGCKIRYKKKSYNLVATSTMLPTSDYFVLHPEFRLTKNPNTENLLELIDVDNEIVDQITYPHGQKKSAAYALVGYNADGTENWQITYAITPGTVNVYQEYRTCPEGKIINEATGNCVKATTIQNTLKDCGAGKYRNPETGRCKSYDTGSEKEPCKEGYERNPETGRCRKVKSNDGADYPVVPLTNFEENSNFIALWALGGIGIIGLFYVIFQFRREIIYFTRKLLAKIKKITKK